MLGMTEIVLCHTDRAEASGAYLKNKNETILCIHIDQ